MFEELFYDRLIKLRTEKKVSAREMSLDIGQSPGYINGLENRNGFPSMQLFFYICEYLQISPKDFFDMDNPAPLKINQISGELTKLDDVQLDTVIAVINGLQHKVR